MYSPKPSQVLEQCGLLTAFISDGQWKSIKGGVDRAQLGLDWNVGKVGVLYILRSADDVGGVNGTALADIS